jgi:hypothetical protein
MRIIINTIQERVLGVKVLQKHSKPQWGATGKRNQEGWLSSQTRACASACSSSLRTFW